MSDPTRILLVRHGQTAWNVATRIQGQLDITLDDHGRWQAQRLGDALAHEPLAAIYSSDLQRARATAQAVADRVRLAVNEDVGLRERGFGKFEGVTFAEIEAKWPDAAQRWRKRDEHFAPEGGETLRAFYERSLAVVLRLAARHPGEQVLLVAHGGVLDCIYRSALGLSLQAPRSWLLGNATINRLLHTGEGLVLVGWNDNAHLEVGVDLDDEAR